MLHHEQQVQAELAELGLPAGLPVVWLKGEPSAAIIEHVERTGVELLIAGALERESSGQHFLGTMARELLRKSHCSLLLFTQPRAEAQPFREIVVFIDSSDNADTAFRDALALAELENASKLHVVSVLSPLSKALAEAESAGGADRQSAETEARLAELVRSADGSPVTIETRVIASATGVGVSDFTRSIKADLLVVPARQDGLPLLPPYMDWVLQVIPCNLWVVKAAA